MKKFYFNVFYNYQSNTDTLSLIEEEDINKYYKVYLSYCTPANSFLKNFCSDKNSPAKFSIQGSVEIMFAQLEDEIININICYKCDCHTLEETIKFLGQKEDKKCFSKKW